MKGHKAEGAKQNQTKGDLRVAEREPLFPRLHVSETEKAGPKAPPRNKMALYEQFTVPSHRFVQPSQTPAATTIYQQQYGIREHGFPYIPYYVPSVPYANMNHGVPMYAQPSHNTSSSGITISSSVGNEEVGRNAPRHQKAGKSSPCKVSRCLTETAADRMAKSLPEQKAKVATVPAQSFLTNQAEESTCPLQNVPSDMEGSHISCIAGSLQEALSTLEVGTDTGPNVKGCESPRVPCFVDSSMSTCITEEGQVKQAAQLSIFEILTKPTKEGPSDKSTVQSCLHTELTRDECKAECATQALTSHIHCNARSENHSSQSAPVNDDVTENNVHWNAFKNSTTEVGKVDYRTNFETFEELKQNRNSEESQPLQCGSHKERHFDSSIVPLTRLDSTWTIKPKDVISAIGQQQFWKARKKLLRQQRIFSDQVFQLHKLVKVQQLLAETPGTLIDEDLHFETIEEFDAIAVPKRATNAGVDVNKVGSYFKEGRIGKAPENEGQPKNSWVQARADRKASLGSNMPMTEFSSVGVSAWGYPSLGPWCGPVVAQDGLFNYQPFGGTLPPGPAFGLPYGPLMPGSGLPMMSFGVPYCDQRPELPAEMGSNFGPWTAFKREGFRTMSVNSNQVSNDLAASWYFGQCNNLSSHRLPSGGSSKDASTGSGASVNKSSMTAQAMKTSYQWGLNCQTGRLHTDGLDNSAHQRENSSPSNTTRLNCHMPPSIPSTPSTRMLSGSIHQDAEGLAQNLDLASACGFTSSDCSKKLAEKEKLVTRALSHSKCEKEAVYLVECPSPDGINDPSNQSALNLFPLVPSMRSSGWTGENVSKGVEDGQGGVIRAVPRRAVAASKSAAGILLSLQRERQK